MIGVDFDNTLAIYGESLHQIAVERQLISPNVQKDKNAIRAAVRTLEKGELEWQKLQGAVYGPGIRRAEFADGAPSFFKCCSERGLSVSIISHKTEYATQDETHTNLRIAAMDWMTEHEFFGPDGLGIDPKNVFFESTRRAKLERISKLGCTTFIDDLEETYLEASFPQQVVKILYRPEGPVMDLPEVKTVRSWREIEDHVFGILH